MNQLDVTVLGPAIEVQGIGQGHDAQVKERRNPENEVVNPASAAPKAFEHPFHERRVSEPALRRDDRQRSGTTQVTQEVGLLFRPGEDDVRLDLVGVEIVQKGAEAEGRAGEADAVFDEENVGHDRALRTCSSWVVSRPTSKCSSTWRRPSCPMTGQSADRESSLWRASVVDDTSPASTSRADRPSRTISGTPP